jgi:hypothetical protein
MATINKRIVSMIYSELGDCMVCIRTAFQCAAFSWLIAALLLLFGWSTLSVLAAIAALGLTVLWAAHLLVHASKTAVEKNVSLEPKSGHSRRAVLPIFLRTLGAAAVLSANPALADVNCPHGTGACGQDNCPDCYRACYGGPSPCVRCRACGNNCGDNQC